ncbi:unnamed protein product, partial [Staurois parvus]
MSCQSAPGVNAELQGALDSKGLFTFAVGGVLRPHNAPGTFFIGFFEFGQGHRGPMIPYCPGAP